MGGTMYLLEQGAVLRKQGERLVAEKDGKAILEAPLASIERVVIEGYVQITTQTLCLLLERGVPTIFLGTDGRFKGSLEPVRSVNAPLRLAQYGVAQDPVASLYLAKQFVSSKLSNQSRVLQKIGYRREPFFQDAAREIKILCSHIERKTGLNGVRGTEGAASSFYFQALGQAFGSAGFARTRRPPRDPVNAMLSYGYTLLVSECVSALATHGLDPYIGFYHGVKHGRPALALDLMEEFRHPFVDMVALTLAERRMVDLEEGFHQTPGGGFLMTPATRKRFIAHYEVRAKHFRPLIRKQAERLIRFLKREGDYQPFLMG
jgi:CRISPR-associated protein Cas1